MFIVTVDLDGKVVTVTGPRGTLVRDFSHVNLDIHKEVEDGQTVIVVESWLGNRKKNSLVRTICSHIENLITGVIKGYRYVMKFVYSHFPVNVNISADKKTIEIRNFLGDKNIRVVKMIGAVQVELTGNKDEIAISGNDLESVSQSAAKIHMVTKVKHKDIRKFLDGIYVSEKKHIVEDE